MQVFLSLLNRGYFAGGVILESHVAQNLTPRHREREAPGTAPRRVGTRGSRWDEESRLQYII